ncbi:hypothetical protein THAOC_35400 [Thalassiosira oceanica]|uniref:Uncharacterized protein n=1 Tax=Thalassiosira oceanica TaxID=159749 RepID=K0R1U3_THAOC|nr:hypothetical protein THAOC_35400 [Thalassiosira oceanica]|eukprot:EJK45960.1 hypothetical protein THAOC_35400 [Thalassiosira oceanica]
MTDHAKHDLVYPPRRTRRTLAGGTAGGGDGISAARRWDEERARGATLPVELPPSRLRLGLRGQMPVAERSPRNKEVEVCHGSRGRWAAATVHRKTPEASAEDGTLPGQVRIVKRHCSPRPALVPSPPFPNNDRVTHVNWRTATLRTRARVRRNNHPKDRDRISGCAEKNGFSSAPLGDSPRWM